MNSLIVAMIVALTNEFGTVSVDTCGAHVLSYIPAGGREVLFRSSEERHTNSWYHGGIPLCWPWFGRNGDPGSEMHGFARFLDWEVMSRTDSLRESRLRLRLKSDENSAKWLDGSFQLDYEIVLSDRLKLDLKMHNTGARRFAVTTGFHPYFSIKDMSNATVRTPRGDIRCVPGMDGGRPFADGRYVLDDGTREIALTTWGNNKLVVWNQGEEPTEGLAPEDWRHFICVEPAILPRMEGIWLDPQATYEIGMNIGAVEGCRRVGDE